MLTGIVGGSAAVATVAALRGAPSAPRLSVLAGTIMIGWIGAEMIVLPAPARSWTEVFYLGTGHVMCALGAGWAGTAAEDRVTAAVGHSAVADRTARPPALAAGTSWAKHSRAPSVTRSPGASR